MLSLVEGINVMLEQQGEESVHCEGLDLSDLCERRIILKDVGKWLVLGGCQRTLTRRKIGDGSETRSAGRTRHTKC